MRSLQPPVPSRITVGLSSYATVSSFSVPMPPEIMITASAARTVSVLRIHPMPVVSATSTYGFASLLSKPGRMPMTKPPPPFRPPPPRLHHTGEPAAHHDRAALRDEPADLLRSGERLRGHWVV